MPAAGLATVLALYLWLAFGYLHATPAWNNPDEPAHFNYVAHLAATGTFPVLEPGDWDASLLERLKAEQFRSGESVASIRYESWQPPLYYLLAAPVFRLVPDYDLPAQVFALRAFSIFLGALTLVVAYFVARQVPALGHRAWLPLAVPLVITGVPMFTAMSAAITNDVLANLVAAVLTLALLKVARGAPGPRTAVGLGLLLAAALLTKMTLVVLVPIALGVLAYSAWRHEAHTSAEPSSPDRATRGAFEKTSARPGTAAVALALVALATLLLLWSPWLVRQGLVYGWGDLLAMQRHDAVVIGQPRFPGLSWDYVRHWTTTFFHSFWAQFGWMGIPVSDRLYWAWGLLSLAAGAGLALQGVRVLRAGVSDERRLRPYAVLALFPLGMLALVLYYNLSFEQAQGRYLFPTLPALAALLVLGWQALLPRPSREPGVLLLAAVLIPLNWYTLTRFVVPAFA